MTRKRLGACLAALLCILFVDAAYAEERAAERAIKARGSCIRVVTFCGRTFLLFAQNAPEWAEMRMAGWGEDGVPKRFGRSGCVPAALANATANCLPWEQLARLQVLMRHPFWLSERYVNPYGIVKGEVPFTIVAEEDFLRFWPLALANLALGNNTFGYRNPQNPGFYRPTLEHLGLRYTISRDLSASLAAMEEGALVLTESSGGTSPFAKGGHYLVLSAKDEEAVYLLDSYVRDDYPRDRAHILQILEPGVLRVQMDALPKLCLGTQCIIWPQEGMDTLTGEALAEILKRSDAILAE